MIETLEDFSGKKLPIFIDDAGVKSSLLKIGKDFTFSRDKRKAKLEVYKKGPIFEVKIGGKIISADRESLECFLKNIKNYLENKSEISQVKKECDSISKNYLVRNNLKSFFKNSTEYYQDIIKSIIQTEKIEDLPPKLSKLKVFKSYHSFLTISLKKGSSKALICDLGKSSHLQKFYIDSKEFNTIYNSIKKSKGKYFYEHKVISSKLKLVGCFLAKVFTLKTQNLIIIISRDDFILPTQNEILTFDQFSNSIEKALSFIETKNILYSNLSLYLTSLYQLNYLINIYQNNSVIAANTNEKSFSQTFSSLWSELSIHYSAPENKYVSTNMFHYQRIKLMGELFNILRHELSNPIFGIKMSLDIIMVGLEKKQCYEIIEQLKESSDRSLELLNNMTDIFSVEQKLSNIKIKDLLNKIYLLCKSELKFISFDFKYGSEGLENESIYTNVTAISQILFNLLINAIQELKNAFENPRQRKICIEVFQKNDFYFFAVSDNGRGIDPSEQEKIFSLFYSKKDQGNGIGLPLSKALAIKLGGELFIKESIPGKTTFELKVKSCN